MSQITVINKFRQIIYFEYNIHNIEIIMLGTSGICGQCYRAIGYITNPKLVPSPRKISKLIPKLNKLGITRPNYVGFQFPHRVRENI